MATPTALPTTVTAGATGAIANTNALHKAVNDLTGTPNRVPWLTVDGIYIREGVGGPVYRTVGYNCYVMKAAGGTAAQTMNAAQRDAFFAGLRPNSLTRVWAYAPVGGTFTWAQVLAELDAIVASAKACGQRLIFALTGMGVAANDAFGGKDATWFTNHTWRTSVSGSTSLQAWTTTVVSRYKDEPTVSVWDIINEPLDTGAAFTADLVLYAQEVAGYVRAANPNALVYAGAMYPSAVGGVSAYQQFFAGLDFCSYHNYDATGYVSASSQAISVPVGMGKPILIDEFGVWAKFIYGTSSDTDKDTNGLPAVNFRAQERLVQGFLDAALAVPNVFGALIWSYMDSDASWYTGLGVYEPVNQSATHRVLRTHPLGEYGGMTSTKIATLTTWIDSRFTLRYPPGTQIGGPNTGATALNLIYDRVSANYRQGTQTAAPSAAQDNTIGYPTLLFAGAQSFATTANTGAGAHSLFAVVSPTALPTSGAFSYLVAPSSASAGFAVRLTSAGVVQLVNYAAGTPTVIGTGTTVLATTGKLYLLEVRWDAAGGGWRIRVNGNADANGTTAATLASDVMVVGAAPGQTAGFVGHILELMKFSSSVGAADQNRLYAYFQRKYGTFG